MLNLCDQRRGRGNVGKSPRADLVVDSDRIRVALAAPVSERGRLALRNGSQLSTCRYRPPCPVIRRPQARQTRRPDKTYGRYDTRPAWRRAWRALISPTCAQSAPPMTAPQPRPLDGPGRPGRGNRHDQDAPPAAVRPRRSPHPVGPPADPSPPGALAVGDRLGDGARETAGYPNPRLT